MAQTAVQILFGFLLAVSFYDSFPVGGSPQPQVLTAALLSSMAAALCFMAPVVAHRVHFREGAKERLVWVAHTMLGLGLALFVVSMDLGMWLVLDRLFSQRAATLCALALVPALGVLWVALPWLAQRRHVGDD